MTSLNQLIAKIEARAIAYEKSKEKPNTLTLGQDLSENSVTKSNALARGYYRFNLVEKRIMEALISQLNPKCTSENQLQKLELKATDYAHTFGVSEKLAYRDIQSAVSGLMSRVFSVEIPDGREEFTLMSNAQYIEGTGRITCCFNPYVTRHLIGLREQFSKYPLRASVKFKSSYTWRIYEILISWAKDLKVTDGLLAGWCTIEVSELRKMLGVPESYPWGVFNKQVLQKSKSELIQKSNIQLNIERIKTARKITHLKFTFAEIIPE